METAIIVLAGFLVAIGAVFIISRRQRPNDQISLIQQQMDSLRQILQSGIEGNTQTVGKQLAEIASQLNTQLHRQNTSMGESRKAMDERLDNAARVIGDVQKEMGRIHESLVPVAEIRDILKAPKQRGGLGEIMLEHLLEEMLPPNMYKIQHGFKSGERVDAAVTIGGQMVPIDSKFPMEQYREFLKCTSDDEKKLSRKALISSVKKHISDVAKYIRPDEGTYPFALMYIPSESIFYDLFVGTDADEALWQHAASSRVFPVSSNTLYVYLQTISFGLRGMQVAEHARELLAKFEQLQKNFGDIRENYEKIGKHLKNAQSAYDDTDKRMDKLENKLSTFSSEAAPALAEPIKEKDVPLIQ